MDTLGRLCLPREILNRLHIGAHNQLLMTVEGDRIILTRPAHCCVLCGAPHAERRVLDHAVCQSCLRALKAQYQP